MTILETLADKQSLILLAEIGALIHDLGKLSKEFVESHSDGYAGPKWEHELILRRLTRDILHHSHDPFDEREYWWDRLQSALGDLSRLRGDYEKLYARRKRPLQERIANFLGKVQGVSPADRGELVDMVRQYTAEQSVASDFVSETFVILVSQTWELLGQKVAIADFIEEHGSPVETDLLAVRLLKPPSCDGVDSAVDKGNAKDHQIWGKTFIATAFGHEAQRLPVGPDEDGLKAVRDKFAQVLAEELSKVRDDQATPAQVRPRILRAAETAFRQALGETRRAANDVTLWDHSYSVASLYKAALAKVLLEGKWTEPKEVGWRFLRVAVDGLGFFAQAHHVTDLLGRRRALADALDQVRTRLEVDYALGNEIYRDESGSVFIMPGLAEGEILDALKREVAGLVEETFRHSGLGGELALKPTWSDEKAGPVRKEMVDVFGQLVAQEPSSPIPDRQAMHGWWKTPQAKHKEICTVCGVRPIGYGVTELYGSSKKRIEYYQEAADKRKVCGVCMKRRGGRSKAWAANADGSFERTIWTDEVADDNGRFALVAGCFDLDGWLDGRLVRTLLVAPGKEKNPSPARIRRVWETTRRFWRDLVEPRDGQPPILEGAVAPPHSPRPFRLRINPANAAEVGRALGAYHVYDWPLRGGITLSVVWVPKGQEGGYLLTADNLRYLAGPEQLNLAAEALDDQTRLLYEFGQLLNGRREFSLREPSGYGRPGKARVTVRLPEEKALEIVPGFYAPYIPILTEPATFMALVPADKALVVAQAIKKKYEIEMVRVRDRLPLRLGLVFAPRRTPLAAVLGAGRAMLGAGERGLGVGGWEKWQVEVEGRKATFRQDGRSLCWEYPATIGDGQTPDIWYPHLLTVNPGDKKELKLEDGDFASVDDLAGPVWIRPSRFDFELLDTTARRFEIHYDEQGRRPVRPSRPFYLDDLDRLEKIWAEICHLEKSQRYQVIAAIEATREAWFGAGRERESWHDGVFRQFVGDTLAGAAWPKERTWKAICQDEMDKKLKDAGVSGELADWAELHQEIMKEKERKDHGEL